MRNSRRQAYKNDCIASVGDRSKNCRVRYDMDMDKDMCIVDNCPIAMAYVPFQDWENVYDARTGLCRGTIFNGLDKPFMGRGCCK